MKLFKKIYLQVFVGCLLLSQVPFLYCLHQSWRQNVEDTVQYEYKNFMSSMKLFNQRISAVSEKDEMNMVAIQAFRTIIGSNGALYWDGEELFNSSPYEFDAQELEALPNEAQYRGGLYGKTSIQTVNGRTVLITSGTSTVVQYGSTYTLIYYSDITEIYERTEAVFWGGAVFSLILLIVIGLVLYRGIYRAIHPLMELRAAAASIEEGNYAIRVPVRTKDEIGDLTVTFNQMAQRVEEHVDRLYHTTQVQRRLIGSLAHELKTPMTAIMGYADTLLTVQLSEKWRVKSLEYIRSECRRLSRLSAKMMELTGLYEGENSVSLTEKSVAKLLAKLKDLTRYRLEEKQIRLEVVCTPADLTACVDEDLMMSLLMNLVDNAYKASGVGDVITVAADERGFMVEDTGKGIPEEEIDRVTEAFYMVDKSRARSAGSIGLGLAFCLQIAQLHNADFRIESKEGEGTKVFVLWKERD